MTPKYQLGERLRVVGKATLHWASVGRVTEVVTQYVTEPWYYLELRAGGRAICFPESELAPADRLTEADDHAAV